MSDNTPTPEQRAYFQTLIKIGEYDISQWLSNKERVVEQSGATLGGLASLMMIWGHVELAEAMVAQGIVPARLNQHEGVLGGFYNVYEDTTSLAAAMLIRAEEREPRKETNRVKSEVKVWDHLLGRQDIWPLGVNELWLDKPVIAMVRPAHSSKNLQSRKEVLNTLVRHGVDINQSSPTTNAMEHALYSGDNSAHRDHGATWVETQRKYSRGAAPVIDHLIELGFDTNKDPHIALSYAIGRDAYNILPEETFGVLTQILLDRGFPLSAPIDCPRKVNPFFSAIQFGQPKVVQALLNAGCDPCWIDPVSGDTLLAAAANPKKDTIEALLVIPKERLAPIANHRNKKGDTPLHQAVGLLSLPLTKRLIEAGADINATNKKGLLPLQTVKRTNPKAKKQLQAIVEFFESEQGSHTAPTKMSGLLHQACKSMADDLVAKLLAQGADPNERDKQGRTPLMVVASSSKFDHYDGKQKKEAKRAYEALVDLLVDAGADIDAQDKAGNTALHGAVGKFSDILTMVLINSGARTDIRNKKQLAAAHVWDEYVFTKHILPRADSIVQSFSSTDFDFEMPGPKGDLPFAPHRQSDIFVAIMQNWELRKNTAQPLSSRKRLRL